ncbi:hypothetical protein WJX75_005335 [Coccomyxa subellipsoidea]|uniref:Uncharacterized protein n=1 Tax=Coccomyxa subellipsoidea TaxID=248742 RepID=A0ABR2YE15_9CHLO
MKRKLDAKSAPNLPPLADAQAFIKSRPWDHLKGRFCPVGRGKVAEAREAERCAGRVEDAEHHEPARKKNKKQIQGAQHLPPKAPLVKGETGYLPAKKPAPKAIERREPQHNSFEFYISCNRPRKRHEREGNCPEGIACPRAHSLEELRTLAAIQQTNLAANFKTERCSAYDTTQTCPRGEMCVFAHGSKQLRMEAAIQARKLPVDFKCHLCPLWWAGETCPNGDHCSKAHGLQELRLQAAINQKLIKDLYKTQRCTKLHCKGPLGQATCWFFHSDQDEMKPLSYKSQFCKTWQETGTCEYGEDCHFAHDAKELIIQTVASKFVEKSVAEDDTVSQFSNEDSVDLHGRREVGIVPQSVLNGKMPIGTPQGKQRRKAAKGVALQLCAHFERTGQCPDPKCRFAHGMEDLKQRQARAKGGEEGRAAAGKAFNPALAPAPRKLSPAVLEAIRSHKLQAAVSTLMGMGFSFSAAENAARNTGANADMAAQLLLDGGGYHEAGVTQVPVKEEVDALCVIADSLDVSTKDVEAEVLRCHGDHLKAMQELESIKLNGGKRVPPNRPPTIYEEDHNHEYLNQGWKNMAQPTWDPTEAAGSSAPVASSHLWKPALLPHYSPASIPLPFHAPQAQHEDIGAVAETEEWQQYRPEDFGPDPAHATGSDPEAELQAALNASLADAPPLGPATGFKSPVADQHINGARPVTQHAQQPPPSSPILSQQTQKQPGSNPVTSMAPAVPQQPVPIPKPAVAPHANSASRNWFPATSDTAAFQPTSAQTLPDALANLHIAPLQPGSVDSYNGGLASGEVTPQPSVNHDLSPQSVIPLGTGPATDVNALLPWLTGYTKIEPKAEQPAPAPSKAAAGGGPDDFDNLMAVLMS